MEHVSFFFLKFCFGYQARIGRGGVVVELSMKVFCGVFRHRLCPVSCTYASCPSRSGRFDVPRL